MRILTINGGSTSLKIERYDVTSPLEPLCEPPSPTSHFDTQADSAEKTLQTCLSAGIDVVAHRFVRMPDGAPPVMPLDATARAAIAEAGRDAPLHDNGALRAVAIVATLDPDVPQLAVSDSTFHRTMPEAASTYALPQDLTARGLRRLGYHGLSHDYAAHRGCALAGLDVRTSRVVTAHLGGGSSLCAIRGGQSIDTTMGYTPLEGVPMATRSGSVDPGLIVHLLRNGMTVDDLETTLERRSGLLGMSGISGDVRELIARRAEPGARLALDVLTWRVRASFGAMIATLGGADLIVFTGGIGEHAAAIRAAILDSGLGVGVAVDSERNASNREGLISANVSTIPVIVVTAREGWQLARAAFAEPSRAPRAT